VTAIALGLMIWTKMGILRLESSRHARWYSIWRRKNNILQHGEDLTQGESL